MSQNASTNTPSSPVAHAPGGESQNLIRNVCRSLTALAWSAVLLWVVAPKGSRWASAAFDMGLAWILLTGGGYFADQTVRSFVDFWKAFPASFGEEMTCKNKEQTRR
jgi:hypothetical protein